MSMPISCACEIVSIRITKADRKNSCYTGDITYIDHLEHGIKMTDDWKAEPGMQAHKVYGRKYHMDINPLHSHPVFGEGIFTAQSGIDHDLRHHIMHAILEYDPNLVESVA